MIIAEIGAGIVTATGVAAPRQICAAAMHNRRLQRLHALKNKIFGPQNLQQCHFAQRLPIPQFSSIST